MIISRQRFWTALFAAIVAGQIGIMIWHIQAILMVPMCTWTPGGWAQIFIGVPWVILWFCSPAFGIVGVTDEAWRPRFFAVTAILWLLFFIVIGLNQADFLMCDAT